MKIVMTGHTGLVGRLLVDKLLASENVEHLHVVGRRALERSHAKLVQTTADIKDWAGLVAKSPADVAISTLGTTLKTAGSEAKFFAIDHDAVLCFAGAAHAAGAKSFKLVSSVAAHPSSRNFYLATKGKVEVALQQTGFDRLDIFQPGLLKGARDGAMRPLESLAKFFSPLTDFLIPTVLDHYRSIEAETVASAIASSIGLSTHGAFMHDNRAMLASVTAA